MRVSLIYVVIFFLHSKIAFSAQSDAKFNVSSPEGGADLLMACYNNPQRDLTCRNIVELNDFSIRFINELIQQSGLYKYQKWLGPLLGVLVNEKLTFGYAVHSNKLDLTYNTRTEIISFNVMRNF